MSEQDKENELKGSIQNGDAARSAGNPTANSSAEANAEDIDLANDPILGGSSINSEDYWFLKLNNMQ